MAVRANWFLDDLELGEPEEPLKVEDVGKPIVLSGDPALNERLIALVNEESRLWNEGVSCAIKDRDDTTCCACPVRSEDPNDPLSTLCRVGCEQERVVTTIAAARVRGGV